MNQNKESNIFQLLSKEQESYLNQLKRQAGRSILAFPASQADRVAHILFSNLQKGGFCTLPVTGHESWDPKSYYYQAARFAAKRGHQIERAFLIPHRHLRHDPTLRNHLTLDELSGIKTHILYVGELISTLGLPSADSLDFGLWDDVIGCIGIYGPTGASGGLSEWRVSRRPEDLQALRGTIEVLMKKADRLSVEEGSPSTSPDLEEPMVTTAPIAWELASVLCQGDHVSPADCSWYHSIWQYLRIFGMVSTPTWHGRFYIDEIGKLARNQKFNRVLISGAADYSMLAHILWAYRDVAAKPEVTVVDLCETPLFLCKWYAKLVHSSVNTYASDIMVFEQPTLFDMIATDAFLTRFPSASRPHLISKWRALLRKGGKVITTIRLEPGLSGAFIRATPEQVDAFYRRALLEARKWRGFLGVSPEEIADGARRYAEQMISYSISSEVEISSFFGKEVLISNICKLLTSQVKWQVRSMLKLWHPEEINGYSSLWR